jgi:chromosome segregation protein
MEAADWLYGVTMQEPGISSIVGVRLEEVLTGAMASG